MSLFNMRRECRTIGSRILGKLFQRGLDTWRIVLNLGM
jgi:hypothetical protein